MRATVGRRRRWGWAIAAIAVALAIGFGGVTGQGVMGQTVRGQGVGDMAGQGSDAAIGEGLLSDPFLQRPTADSVRVVWFTEFEGEGHRLQYGSGLGQTAPATTTRLRRTREDGRSRLPEAVAARLGLDRNGGAPVSRPVWRHEAEATGLRPGRRVPYRVESDRCAPDGTVQTVASREFSLAPLPPAGQPLKILLTSDHQLMPMTAANLQKVAETVGRPDAVFLAGDLVNIPDRASEWFDDARGGAFFPCLQGRARYDLTRSDLTTRYVGGELIQHAPLYPAIGNHEVMGRFGRADGLNAEFNDPIPRAVAQRFYGELPEAARKAANPTDDPALEAAWVAANSFNTDTYEALFTLPESKPGGRKYYATSFGDVRLISLYVTNIWRRPGLDPDVRGRYRERAEDFDRPENWGWGQHIFEPLGPESDQYRWLAQELQSDAFRRARYRIVMFHHPPHTLGDNIVPPYADPLQLLDLDEDGRVAAVRYEYLKQNDYIVRDLLPLLERSGVHLVYYGHSHLWNRFAKETPAGTVHFLESSNVGNTYGAAWGTVRRKVPRENDPNYTAQGDPNGLEPVLPSAIDRFAPERVETEFAAWPRDPSGRPEPYIASNDWTAFSILDTDSGTVRSYRFDTRRPSSPVELFDEFALDATPLARTRRLRWAIAGLAAIALVGAGVALSRALA